MSPEETLTSLSIVLPPPSKPLGAYKPTVRAGDLLFTSGTLPYNDRGELITGRIGEGLTPEQGKEAARWAVLNALASIRAELGTLNRVRQVVRIVGFLQTSADFHDHASVMNGASDVLAQIFGDHGRHARLALGTLTLPRNAAVELEMIVGVL